MRMFVEATEEDGQGYGLVVRDATPAELLEAARPHADLEAAARALNGIIQIWSISPFGPQGGHETEAFAAGIVDAALGADDE